MARDEVSLRDLYLVVRRSALAIVVVVVAVAVGVYALLATRPATYQAEALATVARAPITVEPEFGLTFRPEIDVTFETYSTLAFSRGVLERVVVTLDDGRTFRANGIDTFTLARLAGPAAQPSSLLAAGHRVVHGEPEVAAALASAWAEVTVDTVRGLLHENLATAGQIAADAVDRAHADLAAADDAVAALRSAQDGSIDPQRRFEAQVRLAALDDRVDELARSLRAREAEATALRARADEAGPTGAGGDAGPTVVLGEAPEVPLGITGALWTLEARQAALRAELEAAEEQRAAARAEMARMTAAAARYDADLLRLLRAQEAAQRTYDTVLEIEPTVDYVARLAPTGARVLAEAAVPVVPVPTRAAITAALAAVAAGFAAVVVVLLREAVSDPRRSAPRSAAVRAAEPDARQHSAG